MPAPRLHPHQGAAARGRGRRLHPGVGEVRGPGHVRGHRDAGGPVLPAGCRRAALEGAAVHPGEQEDRHDRGRGPADVGELGGGRGRDLHRRLRGARDRVGAALAAGAVDRRLAGDLVRRGALARPGAQVRDHPRRRRHRGGVRLGVALLRRRRDDRRDGAAAASARGRGVGQGAAAGVPAARDRVRARHAVPVGLLHRRRRLRDAGQRQGPGGGDPAGGGRPRAGLGRPRLRDRGRGHEPRVRGRRRLLPDVGAEHLRGRRPRRHPAARARRLRRGHSRGGADRRARRAADRLRRGAAHHLLRARGRLGRHHLGPGGRARHQRGRGELPARRQRQVGHPPDAGPGQGHRRGAVVARREAGPGARRPPRRQPGRRADRRGAAHRQLGRRAR